MITLPTLATQIPITHEYVLSIQQYAQRDAFKQVIYKSMDELEGWCPKQKASVLVDLVLIMKPKTIVEIGVFGGKSLVPMAYALKEVGEGKVYGIDPWSSFESAHGMDGVNLEYWSKVDHEKILRGLEEKIDKFELGDQIALIRSTSENADPIADIDILHIDGNHSEEASTIDVMKWAPLVRSGGIIIFDDVNWSTTTKAVQWLDQNYIRIGEFTGDNIWAVWVKP